MNAEDISTALKRASELKQSGGKLSSKDLDASKSSPEELESYRKDYHNGIFPPSLKRILKKHIHIRNPNDVLNSLRGIQEHISRYEPEVVHNTIEIISTKPKIEKRTKEIKSGVEKKQTWT